MDTLFSMSVASVLRRLVLSLLWLPVVSLNVSAEHREQSRFARTVHGAGDLNGDWLNDLVVVAGHPWDTDPDRHKTASHGNVVYVYYGTDAGIPDDPDVALQGESVHEDYGNAVTVGDLNGDGLSDLVVAAQKNAASGFDSGRIYVYYGQFVGIGSTPDLVLAGDASGSRFGLSLTSGHDVDADGIDDLLVGARDRPGESDSRGSVRVFLGRPGGLNIEPDWVLLGESRDDGFGWATTLGDLDGDGAADIVVGAPLHDEDGGARDVGRIYAYLGGSSPHTTPDLAVTGRDPGAFFGYAVHANADYDGDGYSDLTVGAPLGGEGHAWRGSVHVFYGRRRADFASFNANRGGDSIVTGGPAHGRFGSILDSGDVNVDGYADLVIGLGGEVEDSSVSVFHGKPRPMRLEPAQILTSGVKNDRFGSTLDMIDTDNDGVADLVIGAPENEEGAGNGKAYIYRGGRGRHLDTNGELTTVETATDEQTDGHDDAGEFKGIAAVPAAHGVEETLATRLADASVQLLGQLDPHPSAGYSDVWGYAANGREYALLGVGTGTSIIDVTDPATPVEVAFVDGPTSVWRDIKTYIHYAYVTTEGSGDGTGMQIIDLSDLPASATLANTYTDTFTTAHNLYIVDGYAYIAGPSSGGVRILDLTDPVNPAEVGAYSAGGYIHDIYIKNNLGYFASGGSQDFDIIDLTDRADPQLLARAAYPFGIYAHQCWTTDDDQFLLCDDEFNVVDILVFDISDLSNIQTYTPFNSSPARIHNIFVENDLAHISYYTDGYVVMSISDATQPAPCASFDTFSGQSSAFNGAWGVYPYAPSGNVYVSDTSTGLYVLEVNLSGGEECQAAPQPHVTTPVPGSPLGGATETFSWTADGAAVTEWWLYVGSSVGAKDVYNSGSLGTSLSATVTGLPTDGRTLHVRLWFRIAGNWQFADSLYTAAN